MAAVEFARNVAMLEGADSTEFEESPRHKIICQYGEIADDEEPRGLMRLGSFPCTVKEGSLASKAYQRSIIGERHRHRYEFNVPGYLDILEKAGMAFTGMSPDNNFVEIIEIPSHPFFIGCHFHPEFKSKPLNPHPLFTAFLKACMGS